MLRTSVVLALATVLLSAAGARADDIGSTSYSPTFHLSGGTTISCSVTVSHDQSIPDIIDNYVYYSGSNSCGSGVSQQAQALYWGADQPLIYFPEYGAGSQCSTGGSGTSCSSTGSYNNPATNIQGGQRAVLYDWFLNAPAGQTWVAQGAGFEIYCSGWGNSLIECLFPHSWTLKCSAVSSC